MILEFLKENLINPSTNKRCKSFGDSALEFDCGNTFKVFNNTPILINESESIFKLEDILEKVPTAQNSNYRSNSLKNVFRKKILPSLSKDFNYTNRYNQLAEKFKGKNILIIGAGDKVDFYNRVFEKSLVITSDVHLQFNPDIVFDAHQIPFKEASFDLIIASQVLEHTLKPWVVSSEMERVVKMDGYLLVEVPFSFPYHSPPYDFFRFTFTGLRSLFSKCSLYSFEASEGSASSMATFNAQFFIDLFSNRYLRIVVLFITRFLFGWMKYFDLLKRTSTFLSIFSPMGFSMIFKRDEIKRTNIDLLNEFYNLKSSNEIHDNHTRSSSL
ncbi:class I SAM-dependent methyltransferase [Mariniflexile sp. HNIBRBA6329]|uniref:class I SAM-dependent methyltransferase n=1 Tax=Mariniflexile sp. HNIBRBA6329 TaxID=3373088 RepID=UPI003746273F